MKNFLKISMLCLGVITAGSAVAQSTCSVDYVTANNWGTGAQQTITITNKGPALNGWTLTWAFTGNETIANFWDGAFTQTGKNVTATNAAHNGSLTTGAKATVGLIVNNPSPFPPLTFSVNGKPCGDVVDNSARWLLDQTASSFYFVSVKNTNTAEPFTFTQLQGTVDKEGNAVLSIPLSSVSTNNTTRDGRLNNLLFETGLLPNLYFTTALDLAAVDALPVGGLSTLSVTGNLTLHGVVKAITFDATVVKHDSKTISLSPRKPILINSADFELNAGIEALRAIVSAVSIGERVPVYFKMYLTKDNPTAVAPISLPAAPSAPTGLLASLSQVTKIAALNWSDNSANETGYIVRRKGSDGRWATAGGVLANVSSLNDTLIADGLFSYKVFAYKDSVPSLVSNIADVMLGTLTSSSSAPSSLSSSVPSSLSSSVPSSVSSVGRSSSSSSTGSLTGQQYFSNLCSTCHALTPTFPAERDQALLTAYIDANMPFGRPELCDANCARALANYLLSRSSASSVTSVSSSSRSSSSIPSIACATNEPSYGPRLLRVLTKSEYVNSISDLVGVDVASLPNGAIDLVPSENFINGFSNNTRAVISSGSMKAYVNLATQIAKVAEINNFVGIVNCQGLSTVACGEKFMDEFGPRVFRRPFTFAERTAYAELFTPSVSGGSVSTALKSALQTALTSPNFLYRSELGVSVADIRRGVTADPDYELGDNPLTLPQTATVDLYGQLGGNFYDYTGNDIIEVTVSGVQNSGGDWPTMTVENDRGEIARVYVNYSSPKVLQFRVSESTGKLYTKFVNKGTGVHNPGHQLKISLLRFAKAKIVLPEVPADQLAAMSADAYVLTPYEVASFLAYTYTGSTPDSTLLLAAKNKALQTEAQIATQVRRLIATAKARQHFGNYAAQWLNADAVLTKGKDTALYPTFTPAVRDAMAKEVREVFNHVVLDEGAPFGALYDSNFTFVNGPLAEFYGITGVTGSAMKKVTGLTNRGGLLTSGAFLSVNAHDAKTAPILRAVRTRRAVLCHDVPNPPNGISLDIERKKAEEEFNRLLASLGGTIPARDEYEFLTRGAICQTCHAKIINPLGFGFENFNAIGLLQTRDYNNHVINSAGTLHGLNSMDDGETFAFNGAKEIAAKIATLPATQSCFIQNTFRMAMGTGPTYFDRNVVDANSKPVLLDQDERESYACEMSNLTSAMNAANKSPKAMLEKLGGLNAVRYRKERLR